MNFGRSVASAGDVNGDGYADVIVGTAVSSGVAYIFLGSATGLSPTPATTLTNATFPLFGYTVAGAGDLNGDGYGDVVVSALNATLAFVHLGSAGGVSLVAAATVALPASSFGGWSMSAGDLNADGYSDLVISGHGLNQVHVGFGGPSVASLSALTTINAPVPSSAFGYSVSCAGDVNGDGYADIVAGAVSANAAYVFQGRATGVDPTPSILSGTPGHNFGYGVAIVGDVSGDGFVDVVVGAPSAPTPAAHLFEGRSSGISLTPTLTLTGPSASSFGMSVASLNPEGAIDDLVTSTARSRVLRCGFRGMTSRLLSPG